MTSEQHNRLRGVPPPPTRPISSAHANKNPEQLSGETLTTRVQHLTTLLNTFREF
jgi:hypothetical protein